MTIPFWILVVITMIGTMIGNITIFCLFRKEQKAIAGASGNPADILKKSQEDYSGGNYAESAKRIETNKYAFVEKSDIAEAYRLLGWDYYYLGIKGPPAGKISNLLKSTAAFEKALRAVPVLEEKKEMSIYNGLPLPLWILGKRDKAMKISKEATHIFPKEPSVWNTRSILLKWKKDFWEAVSVCSMVSKTAIEKGDYLTAGHGQQNKGDALKEAGDNVAALPEYELAKTYYQKHEETSGKSAKPHIDSVEKKIAVLIGK